MEKIMNPEEKIVSLCLAGIVGREKGAEREACIKAIRTHYGKRIAGFVEAHLQS